MARYNAMRNYNRYRNGGVARIRPSSAPMPMSRPNTLLGVSMSNLYGNNIQGYQEGKQDRIRELIRRAVGIDLNA